MQIKREELLVIANELELEQADVELTFDFAGHIFGYFEQPTTTGTEALCSMRELSVLTSVQLDRLHRHTERLEKLVNGIYGLLR